MKLRSLCALTCALLLSIGSLALGQPPGKTTERGDNAALKYWQAFEQMPKQTDTQTKLDVTKPGKLPSEAVKLVEDSKNALLYLHRGAKVEHCDWSLHYEDGPNLLLPHLAKARDLCRLAMFRARWHFENGRDGSGADDLLAAWLLARRIPQDRTMISHLVQIAIERPLLEVAAVQLPRWDKALVKSFASRMEKLPPGGRLKDSLAMEKEYMVGWLIKQIKESGEDWKSLKIDHDTVLDKMKDYGVKDPVAHLTALQPLYDEVGAISELPPNVFVQRMPAFEKKVQDNPVAKLIYPAVNKVYDAQLRGRTHVALFKAAIDVVLNGKEKIKDHPDTYDGKPFGLEGTPQEFVLKSRLIYKEQPVSLSVGAWKK